MYRHGCGKRGGTWGERIIGFVLAKIYCEKSILYAEAGFGTDVGFDDRKDKFEEGMDEMGKLGCYEMG